VKVIKFAITVGEASAEVAMKIIAVDNRHSEINFYFSN
jgi:hypothetical protein